MGVDMHYCDDCEECYGYDGFMSCSECGDISDTCNDCNDIKNLFGDDENIFICDICIENINDTYTFAEGCYDEAELIKKCQLNFKQLIEAIIERKNKYFSNETKIKAYEKEIKELSSRIEKLKKCIDKLKKQ